MDCFAFPLGVYGVFCLEDLTPSPPLLIKQIYRIWACVQQAILFSHSGLLEQLRSSMHYPNVQKLHYY